MVRIDAIGVIAEVTLGVWASDDSETTRFLNKVYTLGKITAYTPWPDRTLAEMVIADGGGKIIKAVNKPRFRTGIIY